MRQADVPSPIDFCLMSDAREWEGTAMLRPHREEFFDAFTEQLRNIEKPKINVLELGSGPGFLALHILTRLTNVEMTLLDYSPAMHELARQRLKKVVDRVNFIERSFKDIAWEAGLDKFDAVVTIQAVHELRHKRYAAALHRQVYPVLNDSGIYLVCDHYCGEDGMQNDQLYMSCEEHRASLESAGYKVNDLLIKGGRALYLSCKAK